MSKLKFLVILLICYGLYKGYEAFTDFEIGVSDRATQLEKAADFERQGEVIALMMYLGDPPELNEHLLVKNKSKCLEMKQIAEETSFAYYECAIVDANLKGGKIISINEENNFNEKIANEDSKLDSLMSVLIILAVTGIIVFWVATQ